MRARVASRDAMHARANVATKDVSGSFAPRIRGRDDMSMSSQHSIEDMVLNALDPIKPMSERELREKLTRQNVLPENADNAINELHGRNKIRWVAFQGWALGGRPTHDD